MGISQEDINNIAKDANSGGDDVPDAPRDDIEATIRGKILEEFATHVNNIFATLTGGDVKIELSGEDITKASEVGNVVAGDWFAFSADLDFDGSVKTIHLISKPSAAMIAGKIMGQDPPEELEEAHQGALKEAAANLMGAWTTGLSETMGSEIQSSGDPELIADDIAAAIAGMEGYSEGNINLGRFSVTIGETSGEYLLLIPEEPMKRLTAMHPDFTAGEAAPPPDSADDDAPIGTAAPGREIPVDKAVFQQFDGSAKMGESSQIELLLDVELTVSVELGRKHLSIKDILDMVPGSLLELDKLAGEPVDLMVNGKLFAYGEVVVIDENFGVRISSVVSPQERLEKLK